VPILQPGNTAVRQGIAPDRNEPAREDTRRWHVFLSYNSIDRPDVQLVAEKLRGAGLEPWFDQWALTPAGNWQEELAAGLRDCAACAVFVGPNGLGAWSREELYVASDRAAHDPNFRVFPVLLPGVAESFDRTQLPPFVLSRTWVDLRAGVARPGSLEVLIAAVLGVALERDGGRDHETESPYRGLRRFDVDDAEYFFGREADVQRLLEQLKSSRFLAVLGPSGSGKSSLVRAGLVAALRDGALPGSHSWSTAVFSPGSHPLTSLAVQIASSDDTGAALDRLNADIRTVYLWSERSLADRPPDERVVLVVDQFEECFTLCTDQIERERFITNLVYAAGIPGGRCIVLLTLRADFYQRCSAHPELSAFLASHQYLVSPMGPAELRRVIEAPAARAGLSFESGLVDLIMADLADQPGALPLLEHALLETWQRRHGQLLSLAAYQASGGVARSLEVRAEELYESLTESEQETARRSLLRLIEPGDQSEDTRRPVSQTDLSTSLDDQAAVEHVIDVFVSARLLTTSGDARNTQVEIAHEALIRHWRRLRNWLDDDRDGRRTMHDLAEASFDWQDAKYGQDFLYRGARLARTSEWVTRTGAALNEVERSFLSASEHLQAAERARGRRRLLGTIGGLSVALVLILALAIVSFVQSNEARLQADIADSARIDAESAARKAEIATALQADAAATAQQQRERADAEASQARRALSNQLAIQAQSATDAPQRRLLIALEAVKVTAAAGEPHVPAAGVALRDGLRAATGRMLSTYAYAGPDGLGSVSSPDGSWLVVPRVDATLVWDLTIAEPTVKYRLPAAARPLALSPDNRWLVTVDADQADNSPTLWDLATGAGALLPGHTQQVTHAVFSSNGHWLVSGSAIYDTHTFEHDDVAHLWDMRLSSPATKPVLLQGHKGPIGSFRFSGDSRFLITGAGADALGRNGDGMLRVWDLDVPDPTAGVRVFPGATGAIHVGVLGPDNRWLIAVSGVNTQNRSRSSLSACLSCSTNELRLWSMDSGDAPIAQTELQSESNLLTTVVSPDNRFLIAAGRNEDPRAFDLSSAEPLASPIRLPVDNGAVDTMAFSPSSQRLAIATDKKVLLWRSEDIARAPVAFSVADSNMHASATAFSRDERWLVIAGAGPAVHVWDLDNQVAGERVLRGHDGVVDHIALSPLGQWMITTSADGTTRRWMLDADLERFEVDARWWPSPDGRWLVTDARDGSLRVWDLLATDSPARPRPLVGPGAGTSSVIFSPDSRWVLTGRADQTWTVWDLMAADPRAGARMLPRHEVLAGLVYLGEGGRWMVTYERDRQAHVWDLTAARSIEDRVAPYDSAHPLVGVGGDGRWLLTGDAYDTWLVDARPNVAGARSIQIHGTRRGLTPDGRWLATWDGADGGAVRVWDLSLPDPSAMVHDVGMRNNWPASSDLPSINWVVASDKDGARVWDLRTEDPFAAPRRLPRASDRADTLAFSSDFRWMAQRGLNSTVVVWDLEADAASVMPTTLRGYVGDVTSAAFTSDGRWLLSASSGGTVRLTDLTAPDRDSSSVTITRHTTGIYEVALSADGRWAIGRERFQGMTHLWRLHLPELQDIACLTAGRNLTAPEWAALMGADTAYRATCPDQVRRQPA
jgi:WD40 repeat protein